MSLQTLQWIFTAIGLVGSLVILGTSICIFVHHNKNNSFKNVHVVPIILLIVSSVLFVIYSLGLSISAILLLEGDNILGFFRSMPTWIGGSCNIIINAIILYKRKKAISIDS